MMSLITIIKDIIVSVTDITTIGGTVMNIADRVNSWLYHGERLQLTCSYRLQVNGLGMKPNNIHLTWNVINAGKLPVYIQAVGFRQSKYRQPAGAKYIIPRAYLTLTPSDKVERSPNYPIKIEPCEKVEIYVNNGNQIEEARYLGYMYVETNTGYSQAVELPYPKAEVYRNPRQEYCLPLNRTSPLKNR